jgi:hypothetical protein
MTITATMIKMATSELTILLFKINKYIYARRLGLGGSNAWI